MATTINDPSPNLAFTSRAAGPYQRRRSVFRPGSELWGPREHSGPWLIGFGDPDWLVAHNSYLFIAGDTTWGAASLHRGTLWLLGSALVALVVATPSIIDPERGNRWRLDGAILFSDTTGHYRTAPFRRQFRHAWRHGVAEFPRAGLNKGPGFEFPKLSGHRHA